MSKKPRMTGFARMLIVLLLLAPVAYIAASYYNGEDGIENIKNILGLSEKKEHSTEVPKENDLYKLQDELNYKDKRIEELELEVEQLKSRLRELEKTGS